MVLLLLLVVHCKGGYIYEKLVQDSMDQNNYLLHTGKLRHKS